MSRHIYARDFSRHSYPSTSAPAPAQTTLTVNVVSSGSNTSEFLVLGETLAASDAVFINTTGKVCKASALSFSSFLSVGFVKNSGSLNDVVAVETQQGAVVDGFTGLDTGQRYFLSESLGKISKIPPNTKGSIVYQVGVAKSSTELMLWPQALIIM